MENRFLFLGEDFSKHIKTEEDFNDFERMLELGKFLHLPARDCLNEIIELETIRRRLLGLPQLKVMIQQPDKN